MIPVYFGLFGQNEEHLQLLGECSIRKVRLSKTPRGDFSQLHVSANLTGKAGTVLGIRISEGQVKGCFPRNG